MTGRLAGRGLTIRMSMVRGPVVLALVGLALLCVGPAGAAKPRSVPGNGVAKVGEVACGAAPCTLRAPSRVRVGIGGEGFRAQVVVPRRVAAHSRAAVRVKLGAKALKALAGAISQ